MTIKRSLDSFLMYAQKRKFNSYSRQSPEEYHDQSEVADYLREITRMVLTIYYRITHAMDENAAKYEAFKIPQIIYDEWIIDIPKLIDFINIYGESNPEIVKEVVNKSFFMIEDLYEDLDRIVKQQIPSEILDRAYKDMMIIKNRDKGEIVLTNEDIQKKMEVLAIVTDIVSNTNS